MTVAELAQNREVAKWTNGLRKVRPSPAQPEKREQARIDTDDLIRRAQQGDALAFEELIRNYDRAVLGLAMHLTKCKEDAQDIYQEAFLRAYKNLGRFRFECSFYTWMHRIVTNLCLDLLRYNQRRNRAVEPELSDEGDEQDPLDRLPDHRPGASPERSLMNRELRERVAHALGKLSPKERIVFELKHYHGLRLRTIAGFFETSEGVMKNTLFRATHKLRLALAEDATLVRA
jgi:RNA polymerase sigma-70 factor, ECF subfamily